MLHASHAVVLFVVFVAAIVMALLNAGAYFLGKRTKRAQILGGLQRVIYDSSPPLRHRILQCIEEAEAERAARLGMPEAVPHELSTGPTRQLHREDETTRLNQALAELDAESEAAADARQHAIRIVK